MSQRRRTFERYINDQHLHQWVQRCGCTIPNFNCNKNIIFISQPHYPISRIAISYSWNQDKDKLFLLFSSPSGVLCDDVDLRRMPAGHVFEGSEQKQQVFDRRRLLHGAQQQHIQQGFTWRERWGNSGGFTITFLTWLPFRTPQKVS